MVGKQIAAVQTPTAAGRCECCPRPFCSNLENFINNIAMGMLKEFKNFAVKGNLIDIGVAFVLGGAFGKVVSSFTDGIVSPLIGLIGGIDLSKNMILLKNAVTDANGKVIKEAVHLKWGDFVTNIINFIIVAFIMFLFIKGIKSLKKDEAKAAPAAPSTTDKLLMEIRDSLKK